jgi:Uma2 family endonuclease
MVVTVNLQPTFDLSDSQFEQICNTNLDLKFERTAQGGLVIMALTGGETGRRNIKLSARLENWNEQANLGVAFDSSTGFRLSNGAIRSPDAAWVSEARWAALTPNQRQKWVPLCPDFLIELKSSTDDIADLRLKMVEYCENGLLLGWLIDPETQIVEIYSAVAPLVSLNNPASLSAAAVMPGFVLNLAGILTA